MRFKVIFFIFLIISNYYSFANCFKLDKLANQFLQNNQVNGMAIAMVNSDKTKFCNYGYTAKDHKQKVSNKTIFAIGSISQTFTAMLAAIAAIENRYDLQAPIINYIPELKQNTNFTQITSQDLLAFVAGIPYNLKDTSNDAALITSLVNLPQAKLQMMDYQYSTSSISLVGIALEMVYDNQSYQILLHKLLLSKLNMHYTITDFSTRNKKLAATGYDLANQPVNYTQVGALVPSEGLKSNAYDLAKYLNLQINNSKNKILNQALILVHKNYYCLENGVSQQLVWEYHPLVALTMDFMSFNPVLKPQAVITTCKNLPSDNGLIEKSGNTNGMSSYIAYVPNKKVGIVILLNKGLATKQINLGRAILWQLINGN